MGMSDPMCQCLKKKGHVGWPRSSRHSWVVLSSLYFKKVREISNASPVIIISESVHHYGGRKIMR